MMMHPREHLRPQGHEAITQQLEGLIQQGRLPHSLLLHGPEGIGKATLAYRLAAHMLCPATPQGAGEVNLFGEAPQQELLPIDFDAPAIRRVMAGSHGDLMVIEPELSGQNQTPVIKVEAARHAAGFFSKTASEGGRRILLIDGAEALNNNAANALLKLVEEPPARAFIILITHQPGRLLPTLLSRCRKYAFRAIDETNFHAILSQLDGDISPETSAALYVLSSGAPGKALYLHEMQAIEAYNDLLQICQHYPSKDAEALARMVARVDKQAKVGGWPVWCQLWQWFLYRISVAATGNLGALVRRDEAALLAHLAATHSPHFWLELSDVSGQLIGKAQGLHLDRKQVIHSLIHMLFTELELAA